MSLYDRILGEDRRERAHTMRIVLPAPGSGMGPRAKPLTPTPAEALPEKRSPAMNDAMGHLQRNQAALRTLQHHFHKESDPKRKALIGTARDKLLKSISSRFQKA